MQSLRQLKPPTHTKSQTQTLSHTNQNTQQLYIITLLAYVITDYTAVIYFTPLHEMTYQISS